MILAALGLAALTLLGRILALSVARRLSTRPLLFLDIDGVICPFDPENPHDHDAGRTGSVLDRVDFDCAEHLRRLEERFDLVWASGWGRRAERLHEYLDLETEEVPRIESRQRPRWAETDWKVDAVDRYARARPAAWIDDSHGDLSQEWASNREAPTLLRTTDPRHGLTEEDVQVLLEWADRLEAGNGARSAAAA